MAASHFGQRLSLISKAEIRYEGTLHAIEPKENTVTLSNVRIMGTEDRPARHVVPPSDQAYEQIVFKGQDVKDLVIYENKSRIDDPAVVRAGKPMRAQPRPGSASRSGGMFDSFGGDTGRSERVRMQKDESFRGGRGYDYGYERGYGRGGYDAGWNRGYRGWRGDNYGYSGYGRGGGGYRPMGGRRRPSRNDQFKTHTGMEFAKPKEGAKSEFKEDFDFESMNKKIEEVKGDKPKTEEQPKYKKEAGFFDSLTYESKDPKARGDAMKQRNVDCETFGVGSVKEMEKKFNRPRLPRRGGYRGW